MFTAIFEPWFDVFWLRLSVWSLFGACIGSLINVVIYRLPKILAHQWEIDCRNYLNLPQTTVPGAARFNLFFPGSHCPHCQMPVPKWSNLPLVGFMLVRGRCYHCKHPIGWRYPLIELIGATLFALAAYRASSPLAMLAGSIWLSLLLTLAMIDLEQMLLPDELTLPLLWLGLLFNLDGGLGVSLTSAVIGAVAGYLCLWLIYWGFKLATGKEGMGYGDFKLLAACGAWLGWFALTNLLLVAALLGLSYAVMQRLRGKLAMDKPIPFGPFLAVAAILVWLLPSGLSLGLM